MGYFLREDRALPHGRPANATARLSWSPPYPSSGSQDEAASPNCTCRLQARVRIINRDVGEGLLRMDGEHQGKVRRIPVWYCESCGEMIVRRRDPPACARKWRRRGRIDRSRHRSRRDCGPSAPRLARQDEDLQDVLPSILPSYHGLRYHLLLGRPDDHDGPQVHGRRALP